MHSTCLLHQHLRRSAPPRLFYIILTAPAVLKSQDLMHGHLDPVKRQRAIQKYETLDVAISEGTMLIVSTDLVVAELTQRAERPAHRRKAF